MSDFLKRVRNRQRLRFGVMERMRNMNSTETSYSSRVRGSVETNPRLHGVVTFLSLHNLGITLLLLLLFSSTVFKMVMRFRLTQDIAKQFCRI